MSIACSTAVRSQEPLAEALATIEKLGFDKVDVLAIDGWAHVNTQDLADDWEPTLNRVDRLLSEHHLTPIALNTGVSPQLHHRAPEINARRKCELDALIQFAAHYGVGMAAIQPRNADPERPWEAVLADCVETLREQKAAGDAAGVTFALELHVRSPFETPSQARALCDAMPEMPLVYDPTHYVMQGLDISDTEWVMDHAVHVHLRDAAPGEIQTHFGAGAVDFDWLFNTLKDRGYQGHFSIEYLQMKDMDVLGDVLRMRDAIAKHFEL
jgi:sugar phosphate isomerase/epimerase